jgi:hypothetical protein
MITVGRDTEGRVTDGREADGREIDATLIGKVGKTRGSLFSTSIGAAASPSKGKAVTAPERVAAAAI